MLVFEKYTESGPFIVFHASLHGGDYKGITFTPVDYSKRDFAINRLLADYAKELERASPSVDAVTAISPSHIELLTKRPGPTAEERREIDRITARFFVKSFFSRYSEIPVEKTRLLEKALGSNVPNPTLRDAQGIIEMLKDNINNPTRHEEIVGICRGDQITNKALLRNLHWFNTEDEKLVQIFLYAFDDFSPSPVFL